MVTTNPRPLRDYFFRTGSQSLAGLPSQVPHAVPNQSSQLCATINSQFKIRNETKNPCLKSREISSRILETTWRCSRSRYDLFRYGK
jgi:hypothetical protein